MVDPTLVQVRYWCFSVGDGHWRRGMDTDRDRKSIGVIANFKYRLRICGVRWWGL